MNDTVKQIAQQFFPEVQIISVLPYGKGLINDTYLIETSAVKDSGFILQRINRDVFKQPGKVMENLQRLTEHIRKDLHHPRKLQFPYLIKTVRNQPFYTDGNDDCWRALSFIDNTYSKESIENISDAEQAGFALGHFHQLVNDLPPESLHDTLPGFHITPGYLKHYYQVLENRADNGHSPEQRYCHHVVETNQQQADVLEQAKNNGQLALRIIHGDPKLNNMLFSNYSGEVVSMIDLDTVKPGLIHYDIGDCLRSCCQRVGSFDFDLEICTVILKAYIRETRSFLQTPDYQYLFPAIQLLAFELGLRFFTDYLEGNRYFKVSDPEQNLHKAVGQFQLMQSIQRQEKQIRQLGARI